MLPLCNFFGISMNELLSGERLDEKQYVENAEKNIISLVNDRTTPRRKVIISSISCFFATLASLALILISAFFVTQVWLRLVMIGIALIVVISNVAVILLVAVSTEIYKCDKCGEKFAPTLTAYIFAPHTFSRRYLKCPHCGKKCWDKSTVILNLRQIFISKIFLPIKRYIATFDNKVLSVFYGIGAQKLQKQSLDLFQAL